MANDEPAVVAGWPGRARRATSLPAASAVAVRVAWGISAICAVALVGLATWGLDRGLDVTDEGYYLLAYQPRQPATWGLTRFDVLEKALLGSSAPTAVDLRAVHLALVLICSLVLVAGLARFLGGSRGFVRRAVTWLPFVVIAQMAGYAFGPPTLSYNHMMVFLVMISLGATLACLGRVGERPRLVLAALAGLPLGVCLFIKGSTSVTAVAFVLGAVVVAGRAGGRRARFRGALAVAGGYALGVALYFIVVESPGTWWSAFSGEIGKASGVGPSPSELLRSYATALFDLAKWLLEAGALLAAAVLLHRRRQRMGAFAAGAMWLTLTVAAGLWVVWRVRETPSYEGLPVAYLLAIEVVLAVAVSEPGSARRLLRQRGGAFWAACVLALAVPLCGAVGTSNNLLQQATLLLGGWAVVLVLLTGLVGSRAQPWTVAIVVVLLGGLSTAKFLDGYVMHPYRLQAGLAAQTTPIAGSGPLSHLDVDPATARFFDQLAVVRRRYHTAGRPMVGMYSIPGVILALGGYAPGWPFIFSETKGFACEQLERLRPVDPILLIVRDSVEGPPLSCLAASGIDLAHYRRVSSVYDPYQSRELDIYEATPAGV